MAYGLSNGHVTDELTWPWNVKLVTPIRLERNISKTTWARDFKFDTRLCMGNATNKFPWKWAWPRSRDPTIFGITVGYPSDSLASCFSSLSSKSVDSALSIIWAPQVTYFTKLSLQSIDGKSLKTEYWVRLQSPTLTKCQKWPNLFQLFWIRFRGISQIW